jgi:putative ABC transport system permease protein
MYVLQNALKNIFRNKGRNILLAAIIFAIIATTVVTLIIHNTSTAVIENYKEQFSSEVSIMPDIQKITEAARSNSPVERPRITRPSLTPELQLAFAQSQYLKESIATAQSPVNSDSLTAVDKSEETANSGGFGGGTPFRMGNEGDYRILGDEYSDFDDNSRVLQEESAMPQDGECLISAELAELNGISVGDTANFTVTFEHPIPDDMDLSGKESGDIITLDGVEYTVDKMTMPGRMQDVGESIYRAQRKAVLTMTVSGIYDDYTDEYPNENLSGIPSMNRRNEILTTLDTVLNLRKPQESGITLDIKYYLKNPDLLDAFKSDVKTMGLTDDFMVTVDSQSYQTIVKPVESMKSISLTFMIVVMIMGAIIVLLLTSISIRERKYEIGVLRAMGMKKKKVAIGLLFEIITISCACMVIGTAAGIFAAQPVSDMLLKSQLAALESQDDSSGNIQGGNSDRRQGGMMGGMGGMTGGMNGRGGGGRIPNFNAEPEAEPLSEMDITIGFATIFQIFAVAVGLSGIAGIFSAAKITKYEPIKILAERN